MPQASAKGRSERQLLTCGDLVARARWTLLLGLGCCICFCKDNRLKAGTFLLCIRLKSSCCRATHGLLAYGPQRTVGVLAGTHWGAVTSKVM